MPDPGWVFSAVPQEEAASGMRTQKLARMASDPSRASQEP